MSETLIVRTNSGSVRGRKRHGTSNTIFYSFQGIPYARPPIGKLRFKAPVALEPWTHVLDATRPGSIAFQTPEKFLDDVVVFAQPKSEDCLYINVYKKMLQDGVELKLPVLVMIHGGGFSFGSSGEELQHPDFLLEHDILYVSVNYRLGALGFLSVTDREYDIPGNAGLKDQSMALRWVAENCEHFGGDSNNITIMGLSAGAASVHYHLISDHSKQLFNRAIIQSGSALNPWASQPPSQDINERLSRALGWNGSGGRRAMIQTIIDAPPQLIVDKQNTLASVAEVQNGNSFLFVPTVEPYDNGTVFVDRDVQTMSRSAWGNSIPLLLGGTSGEGFITYGEFVRHKIQFEDHSYFDNALPRELQIDADDMKRRRLSDQLREFYYGAETPSAKNIDTYMDLLTDKLFWHGLHAIVRARLADAGSAPTFLYNFDYSSDILTMRQTFICGKHVERMLHADDLLYQYRIPGVNDVLPDECVEVRLRKIYNSLFTSFATTGKPTHPAVEALHWEPACESAPYKCLNIADTLTVIDLPNTKRVQYWDSLYDYFK